MRFALRLCLGGIFGLVASSGFAADMVPVRSEADSKTYWSPVAGAPAIPQWAFDVGGRYWASTGKTKFDLFGFVPSTDRVSRLTYKDLQGHSGEFFGRVDHIAGFFAKGYAGLGVINSGSLVDEDFPPVVPLYSSTNSDQRGGKLGYGTLDLGWAFKSRTFGFGFFTGYHFYSERLTAFGCVQTATPVTPYICAPPIPDSTKVIRQNTTFHALRLGFNTEWKITPRWKLATDVAWLPYVHLSAWDLHLLRPDLVGSTPQSGAGLSNWQLEAILSYDFTNEWSVGLGARYWKFDTDAEVHFERSAGGFPQSAAFQTERWGAFFQTSYKYGHSRQFVDFKHH